MSLRPERSRGLSRVFTDDHRSRYFGRAVRRVERSQSVLLGVVTVTMTLSAALSESFALACGAGVGAVILTISRMRRAGVHSVAAEALGETSHTAAMQSSITDAETGLLGEEYFFVEIERAVAAARRQLRPLSLVLLDVAHGEGSSATETHVAAQMLKQTLREADTLCRLSDGHFAILLENTGETGALLTIERLRSAVIPHVRIARIRGGVSCYPSHSTEAAELFDLANKALESAHMWRQDRVEVAEK